MKAAILCKQFFDPDGRRLLVGGVETYVLHLGDVCRENGLDTTIYQCSNVPFERESRGLWIKGIPVNRLPYRKRNFALYRAVKAKIDLTNDIVIFGTDQVSIPTRNPRHVSVQHGINWDLPARFLSKRSFARYRWTASFVKWREVRNYRRYFENCLNTVCVDYNLMNWYRTTVPLENSKHKVWVILNFCEILPIDQLNTRSYSNTDVRILFARRMVRYRGTRIIGAAAKYLLSKYSDIRFTFAGEGPEENWLRKTFESEDRVNITKYMPEKTQAIHLQHDIAVVPSIASEGTSLAVAEAMATGCPVVATGVGGITNMIIDGYNGILVMPDTSSLITGLERLIKNPVLRQHMGNRGYETAREAFSLPRWKKAWQEVVRSVAVEE